MRAYLVLFALVLTGCGAADGPVAAPPDVTAGTWQMTPEHAARGFAQVVAAVEPVAEAECVRIAPSLNCDFRILVDSSRAAPPNAFQSIDKSGRPVITFTIALIASVANADEMAFVMSHEAAHHIRDHLARQRRNAEAGAVVFAGLATLTGGSTADVATA